jgi:hypothetical protein
LLSLLNQNEGIVSANHSICGGLDVFGHHAAGGRERFCSAANFAQTAAGAPGAVLYVFLTIGGIASMADAKSHFFIGVD